MIVSFRLVSQIQANTNDAVFDRLTLSKEERRVLNYVLNSEISNDLKSATNLLFRGPCKNCGRPSLYVLRNRWDDNEIYERYCENWT